MDIYDQNACHCGMCVRINEDPEGNTAILVRLDLETQMQMPEDEGIYNPLVTGTWLKEMTIMETFHAIEEENKRYYEGEE